MVQLQSFILQTMKSRHAVFFGLILILGTPGSKRVKVVIEDAYEDVLCDLK